ncbi:MAG: alcohol dehydrogenase catalytic domain-containing protein, partial [Boseongicola sp.]|nr:alcohol dehydrogenase catalytic domain-containing protein [Boseongicola sp.]
MKAAVYQDTGPAKEVLHIVDVPEPTPGPGEVLVRVAFSAIHPSDVKIRSGARGPLAFSQVVPHSDGAGRIVAVGFGVDEARIGQRVWLWNAAWKRAHGTAAELVALPSEQAVQLPKDCDIENGAT